MSAEQVHHRGTEGTEQKPAAPLVLVCPDCGALANWRTLALSAHWRTLALSAHALQGRAWFECRACGVGSQVRDWKEWRKTP